MIHKWSSHMNCDSSIPRYDFFYVIKITLKYIISFQEIKLKCWGCDEWAWVIDAGWGQKGGRVLRGSQDFSLIILVGRHSLLSLRNTASLPFGDADAYSKPIRM